MNLTRRSGTNGTVERRQLLAARSAIFGGGLGMVAGLLQTFFGHGMGSWSGAKANPAGLGLLTVLLSAVAILSGLWLSGKVRPTRGSAPGRDPVSPQQSMAILVGLLIPAALCFSTVGRLWYLPGVILLVAAGVLVAAGNTDDLWSVIRAQWLHFLISGLGGLQILMAVSAAPIPVVILGVVGGIVLAAAPWVPRGRWVRLTLIALGCLPFAILTWWSLVTPLLALLAIGLGLAAGAPRRAAPVAAPEDTPVPTTPGR